MGKGIQAAKLLESSSVEQEQRCVNGAKLLFLHWGHPDTALCHTKLRVQERTKTVHVLLSVSQKAVLVFLGYEAASSDPRAEEDIKKYPNLFVAY